MQEYTQEITGPIPHLVSGFIELDGKLNQLESLTTRAKNTIEGDGGEGESSTFILDDLKSLVTAHDSKITDLSMVCCS